MADNRAFSYIKGTSAVANGERGNLVLTAEGLEFKPDSGSKTITIPIEKIMDATIQGTIRKRLCVLVYDSNARYYFSVSDQETWRDTISLAAGIYRKILGINPGSRKNPGNPGQNPAPVKAQATSPATPTQTPKAPPSAQKTTPPVPAPSKAPTANPPQKASPSAKPQAAPQNSPPPQTQPVASTPQNTSKPAYTGPWPSGQDYEQSFQILRMSINPSLGKIDQWEVVKNSKTTGWYVYASGNYGSIYKIKADDSKYYAVKCFTRKSGSLNDRYMKISNYLSAKASNMDFLVHFRYYEEGIKTRKNPAFFFPLLKMEWIDGMTLNNFIQMNIGSPKVLKSVSENLLLSVSKLQKAGIAHGDLSGDNIIIGKKGEIRLVDYDGIYIPDFKGQRATEMGHADFQHPKRTGETFASSLDNFSALIIHLSLLALAEKPEMWEKYNQNDPDCLILRKKDFLDLSNSEAFGVMMKTRNKSVKRLGAMLEDYLSRGPLWEEASPRDILSL